MAAAAALAGHRLTHHVPLTKPDDFDLTKIDAQLQEELQLQDFLKWTCLSVITKSASTPVNLCDNELLNVAAKHMPATLTRACLWCRLGLWHSSNPKTFEFTAALQFSSYTIDLSFPDFTEAQIRKGLELCARPFFVTSNSDFARLPERFSGLFEVLIKSDSDVKTLGDCKEARTLIRNAFLGWHCAHEDDDGLSHTAVALAPRKQPMTGQMIQKHIDSVGGLKLIANAPAAVQKLQDRLLKPITREEDHPYRLFLTLLFNDGRGTMVRGENPVVLVNPVVVHVHGTYLSSMATECAVRGWVEPSPSFSLIEQIVMQELMAEFKSTLGLYAEDLPNTTLRSLQRQKPHPHALWHRLNVEGPSPRPPSCARDILMVRNTASTLYSPLSRLAKREKTGMTMSAVKGGTAEPPEAVRNRVGLRQFCETRVKLAANTAAAFQAAAVVFVAQSDGGSKFRDREGRAAARGALQTAVRAMLYDV